MQTQINVSGNNISESFSQVYEKILPDGRIRLFIQTNNFCCGELDPRDSTFYSIRRTSRNIMKMFLGIGINAEVLTNYNFDFIVIPFNNSILRTTRLKWLQQGIRSPFCNKLVDSQIILPLSKINMSDLPELQEEIQLSIFEEV